MAAMRSASGPFAGADRDAELVDAWCVWAGVDDACAERAQGTNATAKRRGETRRGESMIGSVAAGKAGLFGQMRVAWTGG